MLPPSPSTTDRGWENKSKGVKSERGVRSQGEVASLGAKVWSSLSHNLLKGSE